MQYTVYADMLFLINWLMDYALLRAAAAVLRLSVKRRRIALAAAVGAVWVCVAVVFSIPKALEITGSFVVISSLMVILAFRPSGLKKFLRELAVLYLTAACGGGIVNLIYFHTDAGYYLRQLIRGQTTVRASSVAVVAMSAAALAAATGMIRKVAGYSRRKSHLYTVTLYLGGSKVTLQGFLDTGNHLKDPMTGKAVHIVQKEAIKGLEREQEKACRFFVPFCSVGTETGLLSAVRFDRMDLLSEKGEQIRIDHPLIAVYEGRLSANDDYQIILHEEIESRQGETL